MNIFNNGMKIMQKKSIIITPFNITFLILFIVITIALVVKTSTSTSSTDLRSRAANEEDSMVDSDALLSAAEQDVTSLENMDTNAIKLGIAEEEADRHDVMSDSDVDNDPDVSGD